MKFNWISIIINLSKNLINHVFLLECFNVIVPLIFVTNVWALTFSNANNKHLEYVRRKADCFVALFILWGIFSQSTTFVKTNMNFLLLVIKQEIQVAQKTALFEKLDFVFSRFSWKFWANCLKIYFIAK